MILVVQFQARVNDGSCISLSVIQQLTICPSILFNEMNQDQLMQQAEDQWLDDLNEEELKELQEQEEEEMYMQWQAATYAY